MLLSILLKAFLFYVLVPRVFVALPQGASLVTQALVHGLVFGVLDHLVNKFVRPMFERFENPDSKVDQPCPPNSIKCPSGDCKLATDIYGIC